MYEIISIVALILSILAILAVWKPEFLMPAGTVPVSIYRHKESGNYIYCRTGTLKGDMHEYVGEGKIAAAKAVEC